MKSEKLQEPVIFLWK